VRTSQPGYVFGFFSCAKSTHTTLAYKDGVGRGHTNDRDDTFYRNREIMITDLMKNHLKKGMSYSEIIDLIGKPNNYNNLKPKTIGYEVSVEYGWNIDPIRSKVLIIKLSEDSTIIDIKLEKWNHE